VSAASAVEVPAAAKLNLGLRVVGRRSDGFHELDSLFVRLDLADTLGVRIADEAAFGDVPVADGAAGDRLRRVAAGDAWLDRRPLPTGADNLVLRALAAYRSAARIHGVQVPPLAAELVKRIPWGAGLAGGSADAAAALRAAAALCPATVDLMALAVGLGSDVPFCLAGHAAARVGGRGEDLRPIELPTFDLVLVYPGVEVSTAHAFGWWAAEGRDVDPPDEAGLRARRPSGRLPRVANALEGPVAARVPQVAAALALLRDLGCGPVAMSGSGSTCFALVADGAAAAASAAAVAERRPDWWVQAARSG
jgi:4-diphosphocytidyl-2-C-methyl-D-erythritol kinase